MAPWLSVFGGLPVNVKAVLSQTCSNQVSILCILGHQGAIEIGIIIIIIIIIIINILVWCHDDRLEMRAEIGLGKKK